MEKVKKKRKRFCPKCGGDYTETHWHFVPMKKKAGSRQSKSEGERRKYM